MIKNSEQIQKDFYDDLEDDHDLEDGNDKSKKDFPKDPNFN